MTTLTDHARAELVAILELLYVNEWENDTVRLTSDNDGWYILTDDSGDQWWVSYDSLQCMFTELSCHRETPENIEVMLTEWERKWLTGDTGGEG